MLIRLADKFCVVRPEAPSRYPYSNSLYIDDDVRVVVDAGAGGRAYAVLPVQEIDLVLLTHYHFDHVNGVTFFPKAGILAGQEEAPGYRDENIYFQYSGLKRWQQYMGQVKVERLSDSTPLPSDIPVKPGFQFIQLAGLIYDGQVFDLGRTRLAAIHTPGHSHGHYAFFLPEEGILYSGDIDLAPGGPWYAGEFSDFDALVHSVQKIIDLQPDILVTSHRRVFYRGQDDIDALLRAYIGTGLRKETAIYRYLKEPRSLEHISQQDFAWSSSRENQYTVFWTRMMIIKHLERLQKYQQIVQLEDGRYVRKGI